MHVQKIPDRLSRCRDSEKLQSFHPDRVLINYMIKVDKPDVGWARGRIKALEHIHAYPTGNSLPSTCLIRNISHGMESLYLTPVSLGQFKRDGVEGLIKSLSNQPQKHLS